MATPQREGLERNGAGVPYLWIATVIALIAGAVLLPQLPLKGVRPAPFEAEVRYQHLLAEQALARLWEDPFAAVGRYKGGITKRCGNKREAVYPRG